MYCITTSAPQLPPHQPQPETCSENHRTTLIIPTTQGGQICLLCLSNLISNPKSPTVHVSYALSQLSQAVSQHHFLQSLLNFHSHFLISPLVSILSNFDDEAIAKQTVDLIVRLCESSSGIGNDDVCGEFLARVSEWVANGSLAWSRRQFYMLHCFGLLLENQKSNLYGCIRKKDSLVVNLVTGLQLSSEEIQGEVMYVLYKLSLLQYMYMDDSNSDDVLFPYRHKLLNLSLEVLMKSQSDDVRLNCLAFLTVLARRGFCQNVCTQEVERMDLFEADNFMQITEQVIDSPFTQVFAEAVKGPLLSSDSQVQIATLDLVFLYLSSENVTDKELKLFIEENVADYIYEVLRLSGCKDPIVSSSIQVLDVLSTAEEVFRQRLAVGFTTLIPVLQYVAGVPFHSVQSQVMKLIHNCVSMCHGIVSPSNAEEISVMLSEMFKKHLDGEIGMLPETFTFSCSILVALMKCPSSQGNSVLAASVEDASRSCFSAILGSNNMQTDQILHYLYLLKEAFAYDHGERLRICIIKLCESQILPWFVKMISDIEDEAVALGVIEIFDAILLQASNLEAKILADSLVSSSWFSGLFGCMGLFPTEQMKWRVYLIFNSVADVILGSDYGQTIKDAAIHLPSDPTDVLFLLGQKSSHNIELACCQSAVLLLLYISSLYDDRIADDKLVLASLEQYILLNNSNFHCGASSSVKIELVANLYGLYRGLAKMSYQIPYSAEAERILFRVLVEKEWDSLSTRIHFTSLKWFFQQEKLCKPLSEQMLNICRYNYSNGDLVVLDCRAPQKASLNVFAELIASGDNFVAVIFVRLLGDHIENDNQCDDAVAVIKSITKIIEISSLTSDHFCMHGIDSVLQSIYSHSRYCFPELLSATSQLVLCVLRVVQSDSISNGAAWTGITMKLIDYLVPALASEEWNEEVSTIIGILCLILYHSTNQAVIEASKTVLLSAHLVSTVNVIITEACSKGPALFDHDERTRTGGVLIFMLFLVFFSLRSVRAILPGAIDLQMLLDEDGRMQPLSYISIKCHDLCKLMHFGSASIKLIASSCLVELFDGISDKQVELKFMEGYLSSVSSILEGHLFYSDIRVSLNCSKCMSNLITLKELKSESAQNNGWGRLIVEELVMYLSTPSLTSNLSSIHHVPAINVTVALLRMQKLPQWIGKVFNDSSVCTIVKNISPSNISTELVILFRELLKSGYLTSVHVTDLNQVFQACRQHMYTDETCYSSIVDEAENPAVNLNTVGKTRMFLLNLLQSQLPTEEGFRRSKSWRKKLLDEIELFTKCLMEEDEA